MDKPLLTAKDVGERLGISPRTLRRKVATGEFPPPVRFNSRLVRWRAADIQLFIINLQPAK